MKQLDLFVSEALLPIPPINSGVLFPTPTIDSGVLDEYTFKDFINLKPESPGWYYGYVKTLGVEVSPKNDVLFWSGHTWVDTRGKKVGALYSSVYHMPSIHNRPIIPELKEELLPKGHHIDPDRGWRTDKPPFPGAYFATNARDPNFGFVKTWDGSVWSNNEITAPIISDKRMIWFSGRYPSETEIENKTGRYR